jgi:hypothetical protein
MNETRIRMMELAAQGFCCSQILIVLALEGRGTDNPDLVRAAGGLCQGVGCSGEACGVMTGGACLLALYAGKGTPAEERHRLYPLLLTEFTDWFRQSVGGRFGGIRCLDIMGGECPAPDPAVCGPLLAEAYAKAMSLLLENGLNPALGREEQNA